MSAPPAGPTLLNLVHWLDPTERCAESTTCATKNWATSTCEDDPHASAIPFAGSRGETPRPPGLRPRVRSQDIRRCIQQARLRSDVNGCLGGQPGHQQIRHLLSRPVQGLSLIHISEPTRQAEI